MDQNKIGKHIEKLRREKGLTQKELAEKLGLSNTAISKWETGCNLPDISMLGPLSEVLEIDVMELIDPEKAKINKKDSQIKLSLKRRILTLVSILFIIIFIFLSILLFLRTSDLSDANTQASEVKVYEISSNDRAFSIKGYIIFNEKENIIIIDDLKYQGDMSGTNDEIYAKKLRVNIKIDDINIYRYESTLSDKKLSKINVLLKSLAPTKETRYKLDNKVALLEEKFDKFLIELEYTDEKENHQKLKFNTALKKQFTS